MKEVGDRIRQIRARSGLNQVRFGSRLGVSRGAVANWETGKGISTANLIALAREFDVPFEWLTGAQEAPMPEIQMVQPSRVSPARAVAVEGRVEAEVWLGTTAMRRYRASMETLPVHPLSDDARDCFVVSVDDDSVDDVAPCGSYLVCRRWADTMTAAIGDLILVEREVAGLHELTVRRVFADSERLMLAFASHQDHWKASPAVPLDDPSVRVVALAEAVHTPLR